MGIRFDSDVPPKRGKLLDIEANGNGGTNNESTAAHTQPEDLISVVPGNGPDAAESENAKNGKEV